MENKDDFVERKGNPERSLLAAILGRALDDLGVCVNGSKTDPDSRYHAVEAMRWIMSNSTKPFSFIYCCEQVDLDPFYIRKFTYAAIEKKNLGIYHPEDERMELEVSESEQVEMFSLPSEPRRPSTEIRINRVLPEV